MELHLRICRVDTITSQIRLLFKDVFLSRDISDDPSFLMQVIVRALSVLAVMFCDGTYAACWHANRIKFGLVDPKSRPAALLDLTALRERHT